jgi:hypothetical protein
MAKWMLARVISLIGALGLPFGAVNAQALDSRAFSDEAQARAYLRDSPNGPRAKAAFLALVEFRLMLENPGLGRDQIIAGFRQIARAPPVLRPRQVSLY